MRAWKGKRRAAGLAAPLLAGLVAALVVATTAVSGPGGIPVNQSPPTVLGTFQQGLTLSVLTGAWTNGPTSFSYQWQSCNPVGGACSDIAGATSPTYTVAEGDVGLEIRVLVTATNGSGSSAPVPSGNVGPIVAAGAPSNTEEPVITGPNPPVVGQALTAQPGSWNEALTSTAFQWLRCDSNGGNCAAIAGATSNTYTPVQADSGNTLRALVTVVGSGSPEGGARALTAQTGVVAGGPVNTAAPTISGTPQVGQTLTANNGSWTSTNGSPIVFGYQWQVCNAQGQQCVDIPGATQQTYQVQQSDVGDTIRVVVTATNSIGSTSVSSAQTAVVQGGAPPGATIPVSQVSLQQGNRLVIENVRYTPSVLSSRAPFELTVTVTDVNERRVSGAVIDLVPVPFGRVTPPGPVQTNQNGVATLTLRPTAKFPLIRGYRITVFIRATKPGDNILEGVTAIRLSSVGIRPR